MSFNQSYPSTLLQQAVGEMSRLPGIGRKSALRLVLHLLRMDPQQVDTLTASIHTLVHQVKYCHMCHNVSDVDTCAICADPKRDAATLCVVENVQDVMAIEQTRQFRGLYHVLGGVISPMDGVGPSNLEIQSLVDRVAQGTVREIILALSPTMEGDTTNYYIYRKLQHLPVAVSVIARGVAQNDELQYTDEVTLGRALLGRVPFKA